MFAFSKDLRDSWGHLKMHTPWLTLLTWAWGPGSCISNRFCRWFWWGNQAGDTTRSRAQEIPTPQMLVPGNVVNPPNSGQPSAYPWWCCQARAQSSPTPLPPHYTTSFLSSRNLEPPLSVPLPSIPAVTTGPRPHSLFAWPTLQPSQALQLPASPQCIHLSCCIRPP